jgi:hypothetical protein
VLSRAPGRRKTLLLISEGIEYPLQEGVGQTSTGLAAFTSAAAPGVLQSVQQAIGAAARANITIYGIDPRGMATTADETIDVSAFPENPQLGLSPAAFDDELRQAQTSLRILSDATGGRAFVSSNNLDAAFAHIVDESGTYYMLGYQSTNRRADGTYRRIAVRLSRRDLQVKSRAGYVATRASSSAPAGPVTVSAEPSVVLRDALNAPLPLGGVPLRMFAAPVRGTAGESVAVGIEAEAHGFRLTEQDGFYVGQVDLAIIALDAQATVKAGDRQTVRLRLKPETYTAVQARGLRMFIRLTLPAGRYQLRAAVSDPGSGAIGTVFGDVDVPDFHKAALALSGLAIAAEQAADVPTPQPDPVFAGSLPFPPTALRTFAAGETLMVLFEVYRQAAGGPVDLTTSVRDASGRVVFRSQEQMPAEKVWGGESGFGYTVRVPLAGIAPGQYTLRVEAREARSPDVAARQVPFTVAR